MGEDLILASHIDFVLGLDKDHTSFMYVVTEHLRMSGVYWAVSAMDLLSALPNMDIPAIIEFIKACQLPSGGFGGNIGHDAHLLYTLSALQILAVLDRMDVIDSEKVAEYVISLQQDSGAFIGDEWGEVDTRFSYCAVSCLSLLGKMDLMNRDNAVKYILSCRNFDAGFGCIPGAESHSGQSKYRPVMIFNGPFSILLCWCIVYS